MGTQFESHRHFEFSCKERENFSARMRIGIRVSNSEVAPLELRRTNERKNCRLRREAKTTIQSCVIVRDLCLLECELSCVARRVCVCVCFGTGASNTIGLLCDAAVARRPARSSPLPTASCDEPQTESFQLRSKVVPLLDERILEIATLEKLTLWQRDNARKNNDDFSLNEFKSNSIRIHTQRSHYIIMFSSDSLLVCSTCYSLISTELMSFSRALSLLLLSLPWLLPWLLP